LRDNRAVEGSFSIVTLGVVVLSVLVMLVVLVVSDRGANGESVYDQIGRGGMTRDSEAPPESMSEAAAGWVGVDTPAGRSSIGRAEQEREVRQMLSARSARMVARGEAAIDIDAEVAKLLAPPEAAVAAGGHDAELEAEVRGLVVAKNERRARRGLEPLDVAAEVKRTLQELG